MSGIESRNLYHLDWLEVLLPPLQWVKYCTFVIYRWFMEHFFFLNGAVSLHYHFSIYGIWAKEPSYITGDWWEWWGFSLLLLTICWDAYRVCMEIGGRQLEDKAMSWASDLHDNLVGSDIWNYAINCQERINKFLG